MGTRKMESFCDEYLNMSSEMLLLFIVRKFLFIDIYFILIFCHYNGFLHPQGLPLHLQIDTYEDPREGPVFHRGYCQIKVFCDKVSFTLCH
jgi:hypothetical protein